MQIIILKDKQLLGGRWVALTTIPTLYISLETVKAKHTEAVAYAGFFQGGGGGGGVKIACMPMIDAAPGLK